MVEQRDSFQDPFLSGFRPGKGLLKACYWNLMPEPFWGDPDNCSIVIINLNPGYRQDDHNFIGRSVMNSSEYLVNGYSNFAKKNPIFNNSSFHPDSTTWWRSRLEWIRKVFELSDDNQRLPFMLELCPWHSETWAQTRITKFTQAQKDYILDNVIVPAAYASQKATIPIVVSIGKADELYEQLGFKEIQKWGPNNHKGIKTQWPQSKKKNGIIDDKHVYFTYYKHPKGIIHLNIYMRSSNNTPSDQFLEIEKEIIDYIKTH